MVKKQRSKKSKRVFEWPEWCLIGIIGCSSLMIGTSMWMESYFNPQATAERTMATIVDDYYIGYLYPKLLGAQIDEPETILTDFVETGVPTTRLRQLLLYKDGKYADEQTTFTEVGCDVNATSVRYYPVEPFGPRDYTVDYNWQCDKLAL